MGVMLAVLSGLTVAGAVYCMLARDFHRVGVGVMMLVSATNLVLVAAGRVMGRAPVLVGDASVRRAGEQLGNPLPQAFVLTAIVIGIGVIALVFALVRALDQERHRLDADGSSEEEEQ